MFRGQVSLNAFGVYSDESVSKMQLVFSNTLFIFLAIYTVACVQQTDLSFWNRDYHHQLEVSILPNFIHYFLWLCIWYSCTMTYRSLLHIYSGSTGSLFPWPLCSLWCVQIGGHFSAWRSYSFVCISHSQSHHYANLFETMEWMKCCQLCFVEYVSKITGDVSIIFDAIYVYLCFSLSICFFLCGWENPASTYYLN